MAGQKTLHFGHVIAKYRKEMGYTQQKLADIMDVTKATIFLWEKDKVRPDAEAIYKLCAQLYIPLNELFGITDALTQQEHDLLYCFRALDPSKKHLALTLVRTIKYDQDDERYRLQQENTVPLFFQPDMPAAAGTGYDFGQDEEPEYCFVQKTRITEQADTVWVVKGNSMDPVYPDGSRVYISRTGTPKVGSDVVCRLNDGYVIKRIGEDRRLHSLNPDKQYEFAERYDDDRVEIIGVVLGVMEDRDEAKDPDHVLPEMMAEKITQLNARFGIA